MPEKAAAKNARSQGRYGQGKVKDLMARVRAGRSRKEGGVRCKRVLLPGCSEVCMAGAKHGARFAAVR